MAVYTSCGYYMITLPWCSYCLPILPDYNNKRLQSLQVRSWDSFFGAVIADERRHSLFTVPN